MVEHDEEWLYSIWTTDSRADAAKAYFEHMSRWISVDQKLPPEGEIVLLAHGEGRCKAGYLSYEWGKSQPPEYYGVDATNVRFEVHHWKAIGDVPKSKINTDKEKA